MNKQSLDTTLILGTAGAFLLTYLITFPLGWLISDEYSYLNMGMALADGEKTLTFIDAVTSQNISFKGTRYPLGNSFWIAFWIKLCSIKFAYVGSLLSLVISLFLTYKILIKESYYKLSILLIFVYPPLAFFSKTFMSCMPSLLIVSGFLFVLFKYKESGKKWLFLSFIAAFSFWFRETNIVLLGSICLVHFMLDKRWFIYYAIGTLLGLLPRLLSSYYMYDDPFQIVMAESFSLYNFISNASVYGILLLCFMPLGLFFFKAYRGRYFVPLQVGSLLFILMYLFYSFNSTAYSGFSKGILLMGRFMIPILPLYIIFVGWYFKMLPNNKWREIISTNTFKISTSLLVVFIIVGMQLKVYQEARIHKKISSHIFDNYSNKMVLYDLSRTTNIIRYINNYHGELNHMGDISNVEDHAYMNKLFSKFGEAYLIQTLNTANQDKKTYTSKIASMVDIAEETYSSEEIEILKIKPSLSLQIVKIKPRDE